MRMNELREALRALPEDQLKQLILEFLPRVAPDPAAPADVLRTADQVIRDRKGLLERLAK
jgi:hypothetical protein